MAPGATPNHYVLTAGAYQAVVWQPEGSDGWHSQVLHLGQVGSNGNLSDAARQTVLSTYADFEGCLLPKWDQCNRKGPRKRISGGRRIYLLPELL